VEPLALLIIKTLAARVPITDSGVRVYRLTKSGRTRLKDIEASWATLTEGVRRELRWA
jgi:hypothetical protein